MKSASPVLIARAHWVIASIPRTAQPVNCRPAHGVWKACQERRHARHVAVIFTGLVCAAIQHVVHSFPVKATVLFCKRLERYGAKIICSHLRQRTAKAADWCSYKIANECIQHCASSHHPPHQIADRNLNVSQPVRIGVYFFGDHHFRCHKIFCRAHSLAGDNALRPIVKYRDAIVTIFTGHRLFRPDYKTRYCRRRSN